MKVARTVRRGQGTCERPALPYKVSPAYLVTDIDIHWASIVVHRKPGTPDDRWFISEFATGGSIDIPDTTSRDVAVQHAIDKIKALGREGYQHALRNSG